MKSLGEQTSQYLTRMTLTGCVMTMPQSSPQTCTAFSQLQVTRAVAERYCSSELRQGRSVRPVVATFMPPSSAMVRGSIMRYQLLLGCRRLMQQSMSRLERL